MPNPTTPQQSNERLLSIGAVARGSGLSEAVLRMWERRYGVPEPVRLPSGHRRYRLDQVRHLRLVSEALAHGHKPGQVLPLGLDELTALIQGARTDGPDAQVREAVEALDSDALRSRFEREYSSRGLVGFLDDFTGPLLSWVGTGWARGDLDVRHEHHVSELLQDLLRRLRGELTQPATPASTRIVLACLPGEDHDLGLHMVSTVCALHGVQCRILGSNTPIDQIALAAADVSAQAVAVSVPLSDRGAALYRVLADLRGELSDEIELLVGGGGLRHIRRSPSGVVRLGAIADLDNWLKSRARTEPRSS